MQKELESVESATTKINLPEIYRSYENKLEWLEKEPSSKDKSIFFREV